MVPRIFSCEEAALEVLTSVCPSVRPSVCDWTSRNLGLYEGSLRFLKVPESGKFQERFSIQGRFRKGSKMV